MANVFNQMKDVYKLQKEAKEMQKKLREKRIEGVSKDGRVTIYMNAAQEFEDVQIDETLLSPDNLSNLKDCMKDAFKDYQKKLQKEMVKDFDLDKLRGMLGQ